MTNLSKTAQHARDHLTACASQSKASDAVRAVLHSLPASDAACTLYGTKLRLDDAALALLVASREIAKRARLVAVGKMDRALARFVDHACAHGDRDSYSLPTMQGIMGHQTTTQSYYARLYLVAIGAVREKVHALDDRAAGVVIDRDSAGWKMLAGL